MPEDAHMPTRTVRETAELQHRYAWRVLNLCGRGRTTCGNNPLTGSKVVFTPQAALRCVL